MNSSGTYSRLQFLGLLAVLSIVSSASSDTGTGTGRNNKPGWFRKLRMGNTVTRAMTYSISQNQKNAVAALSFQGEPLSWFRLDDGVMGGQSETTMDKIQYHHKKEEETTDILLQFVGNINTNGGGFTSIRAKVTLPAQATGIKIRYKGDGKTYKVLLSNANRGGPFSKTPSWQADLPTTSKVCEDDSNSDDDWDEVVIKFDTLLPAFGGGPRSQPSEEEKASYKFDPTEMKEIGLMLSLRLSDGSPNPKESFGDGEFPFTLLVHSIDIVVE